MRKFLLCGFTALALLFMSSTAQLQAQESESGFSVGGGLAYATELNNLGFGVRGYYEVPSEDLVIYIVPEFVYYLPTELSAVADLDWWTFDVFGHWMFENSEEFYLYALSGVGITNVTSSTSTLAGDFSASATNFNFAVGAGLEYETSFGGLYGEFRFVFTDGSYLVFEGGARFPI